MPRETRTRRTGVTIGNPQITQRSRILQHSVGQEDPSAPLSNAAQLNRAFAQFFGAGVSSLDTLRQADIAEQRADIQVANKMQQELATRHAQEGKTLAEASTEMQSDRDFVDTYHKVAGQRHGAVAYQNWYQNVYQTWTPDQGALHQITEQWVTEELGEGTGSPLFDNSFRAAFMGRAERHFTEAAKRQVEAVQQKAMENLGATIFQGVKDTSFGNVDYMNWVNEAQNTMPLAKGGEVRAWVLGRMEAAALAGGAPAQQKLMAFVDRVSVRDDGATLSDLYPEQVQEMKLRLQQQRMNYLTTEGYEAFSNYERDLAEAASRGNPREIANLMVTLRGINNRYNGGNHYEKLKADTERVFGEAVAQVHMLGKFDSMAQGRAIPMTKKDYDAYQIGWIRSRGLDPFEQGLDPQTRAQRTAILSNVLTQQLKARGELSESVQNQVTNALRPGGNPETQQAAYMLLNGMDNITPGTAAEVLKGSGDSLAIYQILKDQHMTGNLDATFELLNQNPDIPKRVKESTLKDIFGTEDDVEAMRRFMTGDDLSGMFSFDPPPILDMLKDAAGIELPGDFRIDPNGPLMNRMVEQSKWFYVQAQLKGDTPDPAKIRQQVVNANAKAIRMEIVRSGTRTIDPAFRNLLGHLATTPDEQESLETSLPPSDASYRLTTNQIPRRTEVNQEFAPPVFKAVNPTTGEEENPLANMDRDFRRFAESVGQEGLSYRQGAFAAHGAFDVYIEDEITGLDRPMVIPIEEPFKYGEQTVTLTGDLENDRAIMTGLKANGALPDGIQLVPWPDESEPMYYRAVVRPTWRTKGLTDDQIMEKAGIEQQAMKAQELNQVRQDLQARGLIGSTLGVTKQIPAVTEFSSASAYADAITNSMLEAKGPDAFKWAPGEAYSDKRFEFITGEEGFSPKSYEDNGYRSIGYGFNMVANKEIFKSTLGIGEEAYQDYLHGRRSITESQGRKLFNSIIKEFERTVSTKFKGVPLSEHERLALVSLAYNGPVLITDELVAAIKGGNKKAAINEVLSFTQRFFPKRYHKAIAGRRYREAELLAGPMVAQNVLPNFKQYLNQYR